MLIFFYSLTNIIIIITIITIIIIIIIIIFITSYPFKRMALQKIKNFIR